MQPASTPTSKRRLVHGTAAVLAAEALALPTGLVTAGVLTRALGPSDYGLLTLSATLVSWVQWTITSALSRPAIKFVSQSPRPLEVGSAIIRIYTVLGMMGAAVMVLLAGTIARSLDDPALAAPIRLFAVDIVIFGLAQAHRSVLIGLGLYYERAWASAARWLVRLGVIVLLIWLGFGITGAILGSIGASLAEFAVARWYVRPPFSKTARMPAGIWVEYMVPVTLVAISLRLFDRLDIVLLKALGGSAADAGMYGAAQNLAGVPGLFALSFSPLVLSSLTRARHQGHDGAGRTFAEFALRIAVLVIPFVALAAACAHEIVRFVFGATFAPAGSTLAILLGSAMSMLVISVTTAVLLAFEKPSWAAWLTVPLVPIASIAHLIVIPSFGAAGAATVTTLTAAGAAIATLITVHAAWSVLPGPATWLRASVASVAIVVAANAFPVDGVAVLAKLAILSAGIVAVYLVIGGVSLREAQWVMRRAERDGPAG